MRHIPVMKGRGGARWGSQGTAAPREKLSDHFFRLTTARSESSVSFRWK